MDNIIKRTSKDFLKSLAVINIENKTRLTAYLVAVMFCLLLLSLKLILGPVLQFHEIPYFMSFIAVALTAAYGGVMAGLFATLILSVTTLFVF